jgi:acetylornithine deacetylase/succinyl-diaminopimelate desuccinylase-like protein
MRRTRTLVAGILALAVPAAGSPGAPASPLLEAVRAHVRAEQPALLREYVAFLALPNLASDAENIRRNAVHVAQMLEKRGIAARLLDGEGGPPAVYGELTTPGARKTLAIYAHYDGQPVDLPRWASPPWTPVLRDGPLGPSARELSLSTLTGPLDGEWRLFARSSSDDKVSIFAVLAALDALRATGAAPAVNLKLLFEGEEERGSPHLRAVLERSRERLRADAWLLGDGPVHQSRRMQLYFGARGVSDVEITLYGPARPLHSGHYGNWAPNPAVELAQLLAGLRDRDGRITIAGWYDDVRPVTDAERTALAAVPDVDAALRDELALAATEAGGARLVERILLPALNLRGIASGAVGATAANAIPTDARASIDFRLVPDETPARVRERFEAHLRARGYALTHVEPTLEQRRATPRLVRLEWGDGYPAARTSMDLPFSRALVRVVGEASGGPLWALPTLGGSIPMYLFAEVFHVPVVGLPIANHDNNQHGADENLRLQNLWDGIAIYAGVLAGLGDGW